MIVETIRMSSKGQVVIPQGIREDLHASEGTVFAVTGSEDTVILKKVATPNREDLIKELSLVAKKAKAHLQKKGFTERDLKAK